MKQKIDHGYAQCVPNMHTAEFKPLLVSGSVARKIIGVGNTKFWDLVKAGKIKLTDIGGGRRMVIYSSLEALVEQEAA